MRPKPVAYFLCAVSLALIAICPFILRANSPAAEETAPYKGILTMWHITLWRTGGSSFEAYLRKRIKEFEADYAYAFIELESLTAEEAAQALAAGEAPDLISYPMGANPGVALQRLPSADTVLPGRHGDGWPYTCGGYCILVNTDLLDEQNADIPESGWGLRPEALIDAAQYGAGFDAEPGCSALPALALHQYPESDEPSYSTWGEPNPPDAMLSLKPQALDGGLDAFLSGDCAVLIASQRQLFEAEQAFLQGSGPAFFAYAIGGYTDMVQMIGVATCEDEKKLTACATFARYLLSNPAQRKLEPLGTLPVVSGLNAYEQDECRRTMYGLLCENAALPDTDEVQELNELAAKALGGNEDALKQLRARLG
jgi:ABC-type glycerol-3-phosphate transport system substrate-binding protein